MPQPSSTSSTMMSSPDRSVMTSSRPDGLPRGGIRIVGRPFPASALAEHAPQAQEDEHRQRQENDGVDVEQVEHAFRLPSGLAWPGAASTALDATSAATIYLTTR